MKKVILYMMPAPYLTRCAVTPYPGNCIARTQTMPEESFEHIFTDPSYENPVRNRARSGAGYGRF